MFSKPVHGKVPLSKTDSIRFAITPRREAKPYLRLQKGIDQLSSSSTSKIRGITLVEVLIVLGMMAVILTFFANSFTRATNKADLLVAAEGVNFSVQSARNMARQLETEVIMHLNTATSGENHSIDFSYPDRNEALNSGNLLQEFVLPADIHLMTDESAIHFDARGLVEKPTDLLLISQTEESMQEIVLVR